MPWFKVDDKLHDHRKSRRAKKPAMGVWVLAGSWSADHLTDGFIPADVLPRWGDAADADALVAADLWIPFEKDGETGWLFLNWEEYQPTKAEIESERAAKVAAGRKGGVASGRSRRKAGAKARASQSVEPPTRPDPTPSAAAAAEGTPPPQHPADLLPAALDLLRSRLETQHRLFVRWDKLTPEHIAEMTDLIETHGDAALIKAALTGYRANDPIMFAQGWLSHWRQLRPQGRLEVVRELCPTHQTQLSPSGTCNGCVVDAKVGDR